ncbi:hypothetical protein [Micromonospora sp. NBRC 101691]|uniref:hypothetical protein n=1 Tax=Micromonospora sp. NBRC 101691 TaxID=3032198 RepID=UPI0024A1E1B6|nr:hypothetical protein [Micromonospora sp. NBRC 101691]GLY21722.1 hypothetical protein Misp04_14540 [Micromonospora sp. NBRC 101691]
MYDAFHHRPIHHRPIQRRLSDERRTTAPRLSTKILCTLATIQSIHVVIMLVMGSGAELTRRELVQVFVAALIGIPALYLLARDMVAAPSNQNNVKAFRLGVGIGRVWRMLRR